MNERDCKFKPNAPVRFATGGDNRGTVFGFVRGFTLVRDNVLVAVEISTSFTDTSVLNGYQDSVLIVPEYVLEDWE